MENSSGVEMFLDNSSTYKTYDPNGYFLQFEQIPFYLNTMLGICQNNPLSVSDNIQQITLVGSKDFCIFGNIFLRNYDLPKKIHFEVIEIDSFVPTIINQNTLLVLDLRLLDIENQKISSILHSQNLSTILVITTIDLSHEFSMEKITKWVVPATKSSIEWAANSTVICLNILEKFDFKINFAQELDHLVHGSQDLLSRMDISKPAIHNPAKRLAGQLLDRLVNLVTNDDLAPIGMYWQKEFKFLAKNMVFCSTVSNMDSDIMAEIYYPPSLVEKAFFLFLREPTLNERVDNGIEILQNTLLSCGFATDLVTEKGGNAFSRKWNLLLMGSLVAYYLAIANGATIEFCQ